MFIIKVVQTLLVISCIYLATWVTGCNTLKEDEEKIIFTDTLSVTASAYNSLKVQGQGNPSITAWGDTLRPGVRSIAVSRDLLRKGLKYKTPVKIEGFEGTFIVNDKMHSRWRNKIDIYMGLDKEKAIYWGRKKIKIAWPAEEEQEKE